MKKQLKFWHFGEFLDAQYWGGSMSSIEIAKMCNCNKRNILYQMQKTGIGRRARQDQPNYVNITRELEEMLEGELLGDGNLIKHGRGARYQHSNKYPFYIGWLFNKFMNCGIGWNEKVYSANTPWGTVYMGRTWTYRDLVKLQERFYPNGKKIVPTDIELTPTILKHWYIGDGCFYTRKRGNYHEKSITMATNGFTYDEVEFLTDELNKLGIKANLNHSQGYTIVVYKKSAIQKFFNYIGDCPEEIKQIYGYKFPIEEQRALTYSEEEIRNGVLK